MATYFISVVKEPMGMKTNLSVFVALGCMLLVSGCAVNPVTRRQNFTLMSEAGEIQKGQEAAAKVRKVYSVYKDLPGLHSYVTEVGQKLVKISHRSQLDYNFTVLDSPQVNAFALPGGYVYITRGLLAYLNSEAELAAVLGHEIGHITARHSVQQYSAAIAADVAANVGALVAGMFMPPLGSMGGMVGQAIQTALGLTGSALVLGYGRSQELEADRLGAQYLARSGYDPKAMITVIGALKNQELFDIEAAKQEGRDPRRYHGLFATHPDNDTRVHEVVGEASKYEVTGVKDDHRAEFLRQTDGMIFGDSADHGVLRHNRFQHGKLGIWVTFPAGWRAQNQPDSVTAASPDRETMMSLSHLGNPEGSPADFARNHFHLKRSDNVLSVTNNGLPAALVTSTTQDGEPFKAGIIYLDNNAYLLIGRSKSSAAFARDQSAINGTIESFRPLTEAEKNSLKPLEIRTIMATKGMTYAELAHESPLGQNAENYLRLINGQYNDGEPIPGLIIKIVK